MCPSADGLAGKTAQAGITGGRRPVRLPTDPPVMGGQGPGPSSVRSAQIGSARVLRDLAHYSASHCRSAYTKANLRSRTGWTPLLEADRSLVTVLVEEASNGATGTSCSSWRAICMHVHKPPSSARSLISWRTSCRMLTNRAIVAQGCIGWERASANRSIRRVLERCLSRGGSPVPLPGWYAGDQGRCEMTSGGSLTTSGRAVAVRWEQWVLTSVSRDSFHAGHPSCSKLSEPGAPLRNRTVDLLLTMHAGFVRWRRVGSDYRRPDGYWCLNTSHSVWCCLRSLSLGLSLAFRIPERSEARIRCRLSLLSPARQVYDGRTNRRRLGTWRHNSMPRFPAVVP